jgi:transcriptional regulator with XRE-family HTH domain
MTKGYSTLTVREVEEANQELLGVKLGNLCIAKGIPVVDVSEYFGVSRVTVYSWFRGKTIVSGKHIDNINKLIQKLS